MLSEEKNTLFLKRLWWGEKKKITCPGNFPPIPHSQTKCKIYFLKTSTNSITEYLTIITDLYKQVKHPIKNSNNKRNKEGIHLKNLAKQLELYKQNPATGGNGGGMGVRERQKQETGLFNCVSHTTTPHPRVPLSPGISCSEHWAHFLSPPTL